MGKGEMFYRFIIKPALPALFCIAGFLIGALLGMFEPMLGFGWGGIFGAVLFAVLGKMVQTMLSHIGL